MRALTILALFALSVVGCSDGPTAVPHETAPEPVLSDIATSDITTSDITISAIDGPSDPAAVNTPVKITAHFSGASEDTHTAVIRWGDGASTVATVTELAGAGTATAARSYALPGVYTVEVEVSDPNAGSVIGTHEYVTVYDPNGGYVSGNGAILSPANACTWSGCVTDEGVARFGFSSRYRKGANVPDGRTRFTFRDGNFTFRSTAYQWLTIAGARAQYKGEGTVNREGNYGFMLTAVDSDRAGGGLEDLFRIKIWDQDDDDRVVYDNKAGAEDGDDLTGAGTRLTRGSITIRTTTTNQAPVVVITSPADGATVIEDEEIQLSANAGDAEDGDLSATVAWSSDLAGALGTGASLAASILEPGTHIVTASVTDSGGLEGNAAITIHAWSAELAAADTTVTLRERNGAITESDADGPYCQPIDLSAFVSSGSGVAPEEMAYRVASVGETGALFEDAACAEDTELSGTDFEGGAAVGLTGTMVWYAPPQDAASVVSGAEPLDGAGFTYQASPGSDVWSTEGTVTIAVLSTDNDIPDLAWSTSACPEDGYCEIQLVGVDPDPADTHTFTITDINTPGLSTLHHYDETQPDNVGERITSGTVVPGGRLVYVPAPNFFGQVANLFAASVEDQDGLINSGNSVTILIAPQDDPPLAFADTVSLFPHDIGVTAISVDVKEGQLFGESDDLEIVINTLPTVGVLKVGDVEIAAVGTAVPCGGSVCGAVFDYLLSAGSHTYESVVDSFQVRVRDVATGGTSDPVTVSVFLAAPVQTRLLSSSEWSYAEGGSVEMMLTFEGAFATSMWLGPLDWHNPPAVSVNDVAHSSGVVYAESPYRVGNQTEALWEGRGELVTGTAIPSVEYAAESCTDYTCTFKVKLRACEGAESSAEAPCNPNHSGIDVIPFAVTTQADADGTGQFGGTSAAVTTFGFTVDIRNDYLDAAPVMPALDPQCSPDSSRIPATGSGFLDSAGQSTTADLQHYWCADAVISSSDVYEVSIFGVGALSDGLDANGDADAWRMEVTYYRAHTGSVCAAGGTCVYQRADVPGDDQSLTSTPPVITDLSVTLDETAIGQLSGLTIDYFSGGYGFTVEHADLLELRRALYYGIYTEFAVRSAPEHDAVQIRLYSRDTGTSAWTEQGTEYLLLVRDDSSLTQIVTAPDPDAYPGG